MTQNKKGAPRMGGGAVAFKSGGGAPPDQAPAMPLRVPLLAKTGVLGQVAVVGEEIFPGMTKLDIVAMHLFAAVVAGRERGDMLVGEAADLAWEYASSFWRARPEPVVETPNHPGEDAERRANEGTDEKKIKIATE